MRDNALNGVSIMIIALAITFLSCQESAQESIVKPITLLQPAFRINADDHPELTLSDFLGFQAVGDFKEDGERVIVFCNMRNRKLIYYNSSSDSITKQFSLPGEQDRFPLSDLRILGKDSILYFNTNEQELILFNTKEIVAKYKLPLPISNEPNSVYSNGHVLGVDAKGWHGLMAWANYEDPNGDISDSLMDIRNLYSFFDISSGELNVKTYPVKPFFKKYKRSLKAYHCCPYFTYNDSLNRIDYYYSIADTIKSYYIETGKIETRIFSGTQHLVDIMYLPDNYNGEEFVNATKNKTLIKMYYDSINNYYVRRVVNDTTTEDNGQLSRKHIEILNDEFEVLHDEHVFTGRDPNALTLLSDGVYFARLDRKNKTWVYDKVVYSAD